MRGHPSSIAAVAVVSVVPQIIPPGTESLRAAPAETHFHSLAVWRRKFAAFSQVVAEGVFLFGAGTVPRAM